MVDKVFSMLVDGRAEAGSGTFDVINPALGEPFAQCPKADLDTLNRAVAAAKAAFGPWSQRPASERADLVAKLADAMEARAGEFAALLTSEQGKPLDQAMYEVMGAVFTLRAFAAMKLEAKTLRDEGGNKIIEHRTPLGVVAAITPWNFPVILLMNKLGPALVTGNTMVAKPAPTTPLTSLLFGELCAEILPPGVVNIICDENDLGSALTAHPDVAKVAFTGSTATGKKVMASAAGTVKRVTLELGGNDAAIVLDDVDPVQVARKVYGGAMANAGQICVAIKRAYVPEAMYDEFCNELARLAQGAIVDDGAQQGAQVGPVQNRMQFEKVKALLDDARGARHGDRGRHRARPAGLFHPADDRARSRRRCAAGARGAVRPGPAGAQLHRYRRRDRPGERFRIWPWRHRVGPRREARDRCRDADRYRHRLGQPVSRDRRQHPLPRIEAVGNRRRARPGGTRGIYPGAHR